MTLLYATLLADCGNALTGNCYGDLTLGAAIAGALVLVARYFGWAWLEKLAEAIIAGKRPAPDPAPEGETPPATPPAEPLALVALPRGGGQVAVPGWLSVLLMIVPTLLELIQKLFGEEAGRLGRELTPTEKQEVAVRVGRDYLLGRVRDQAAPPSANGQVPAGPGGGI